MPVRKIKANYLSLTGNYHSFKFNKMIGFESNLEQDLLYHLDFDLHVKSIEEQPFKLKYKSKAGRLKPYVPDFKVMFDDKSEYVPKSYKGTVVYEVKYRKDLKDNWKKLVERYRAMHSYCKEQGWKFRIITDYELKSDLLENIKLLDQMRRGCHDLEFEHREAFLDVASVMKEGTINELLVATYSSVENRAESLSVLWRMICNKDIGVDLSKRLNQNSNFWAMT